MGMEQWFVTRTRSSGTQRRNGAKCSFQKCELPSVGFRKIPQEIIKYLVEKVPAWYFDGLPKDSSGLPLLEFQHMSINAFQVNWEQDIAKDSRQVSKFISAWENNTPFPPTQADFYPLADLVGDGKYWVEGYDDYPEELKKDGYMLDTHRFLKSYVRLMYVEGVYYNTLLFTAKPNQSWCESRKIPFLNWTLSNPMEVKE